MAKLNQLKSGAVLSYVTLIVGNLVSLLYTPLMLRIIGPDEHGLYSIAQSVVNYLTLLSFGFGGSIVRYITKYRTLGDKENEEKTFGLFILIYSVFSVVVLAVGFGLSLGVEKIFAQTLSGDQFRKMRVLLILMSVNVMITFISTVFSSIIIAHERFIFNKLLSLVTTILSPCVSIALLFLGFASVGMTLAATTVNIISLVGYAIYCLRKLKIKPRFKNLDFGVLKEIIGFSLFIFLMEIANLLYFATDRVLLGAMVSTAAVSVYTVGATLSNYLNTFTTAISGVLMPRVTSMVFSGATKKEIDDIFIKVGRLQFIIVSFVISAFAVFGRQFMPLFAGDGYDESYWIALILMVPLAVPLIQSVAVNIITARNKHMFRSLVLLGVAVLNVALTCGAILLGMEGIGAAIASGIAAVIGTISLMNWYYYKKMNIDIPRFWLEILKLCPVPVGMLLVGLGVTHFVDVSGVWRFLIGAVIFTVIYLPLLWVSSLNEYEKGLFGGVFKKIQSKFRKGTNKMKIIGMIPARGGSTRFNNKPLADICGHPMIWWVHKHCKEVECFDEVYVATDSEEIRTVCEGFGAKVIMTSSDHDTATERLYEVSQKVDADLYVMVNGDEPVIKADDIVKCIPEGLKPDSFYVSNLMTDFSDPVEVVDSSNLKIVTNKDGICLFISRSPIPFPKGAMNYTYHKFVGVGAFTKKALEYYHNTERGPIEKIEENDSFRFIENRKDIYYINAHCKTLSVDTPKDIAKVAEYLQNDN